MDSSRESIRIWCCGIRNHYSVFSVAPSVLCCCSSNGHSASKCSASLGVSMVTSWATLMEERGVTGRRLLASGARRRCMKVVIRMAFCKEKCKCQTLYTCFQIEPTSFFEFASQSPIPTSRTTASKGTSILHCF